MLEEYESLGDFKGMKKKAKKFWKSLTPREKEGLKRLGVVGAEGAGIALALAFEPQALPIATMPASLYINRQRLGKVYKKIKEVV